jgi:hypothetical protein
VPEVLTLCAVAACANGKVLAFAFAVFKSFCISEVAGDIRPKVLGYPNWLKVAKLHPSATQQLELHYRKFQKTSVGYSNIQKGAFTGKF